MFFSYNPNNNTYRAPNAARTRTQTAANRCPKPTRTPPTLPSPSQVIDGMLTVRKIENVAVGANSKPKLPIVISQCGVRAHATLAPAF